jgi:HlyD family secretion protein
MLYSIALMMLAGLLGCGHPSAATTTVDAVGPTEVAVASPVRKTLHYTIEQPGRIEAFEQTPIYARVAGYVSAVKVDVGTRVKRGDLLAELDVPELVEEHKRKEALVVQARLGIAQAEQNERVAEASTTSARAGVEVAHAMQTKAVAVLERWRSEYTRMDRLVQDKVVDRQSRDEVQNQFRAADAGKTEADARIRAADSALIEAMARREKARADSEAARNQLTVAEADERAVKALVGYTRITAPYDGIVSDRRVHTGHFLPAATGATRGDPLFVVVRIDKVRAFVEVPEGEAVQLHDGDPGRIRVQVLGDREFTGKVMGTSWSLDPSQRTLRAEIDLENPEQVLRPGMYVHALIDVERSAWVLPPEAVLVRDASSFCYQIRDGKTHAVPVRTGLRQHDSLEIVKFQAQAEVPGAPRLWVNPAGKEVVVLTKVGELIENQAVQISARK